jgi:hypothetical protein
MAAAIHEAEMRIQSRDANQRDSNPKASLCGSYPCECTIKGADQPESSGRESAREFGLVGAIWGPRHENAEVYEAFWCRGRGP